MIGNSPYFFATSSSDCDFSRCCHSGVRLPGRARGISSARAAFSRKRAPNSALSRQLGDDAVLDLVGLDHHQLGAGRLLGVGQVDDDPVVGPDRVGLEPELVADPRAQRQPPGGVDAPAERRQHAQPPVADLVAEALDDDRAVGRAPRAWPPAARAGTRRRLFAARGVEVVVALEHLGRLVDRPARERADRLAELLRAARRRRPSRTGPRRAARAPA